MTNEIEEKIQAWLVSVKNYESQKRRVTDAQLELSSAQDECLEAQARNGDALRDMQIAILNASESGAIA